MRLHTLLVAGLLTLVIGSSAAAQNRTAPTIDVSAGWTGFADDGIVSERPAGAAFRWYVTPRLSIGPEVIFIAGDSHSHQMVTGNLMFDFIRTKPGGLTPYVVVGGGLFRTLDSFNGESYASNEGTFAFGGGLRYRPTERVSIGIDARNGWEPHLRLTGVLSIHLGK